MADELVGRAAERSALRQLLREGPRTALVSGEAGIGKSALLAWLAREAGEGGWTVLRAAPAQPERVLPFSSLVDLLGPVWPALRPRLPEPQAQALDFALLQSAAPGAGRGELAVRIAVRTLLEELAADGRCLLLIDDVPWLDAETSAVLAFALRRLDGPGPTIVFGQRSGSQTPETLGPLVSSPSTLALRLGPMSAAEVTQIVADRVSVQMPDPAARSLHAAAGGNPLFALELARTLPAGGRVAEAADGPPPLPETVCGLLQARLAPLAPATRNALTLVATAGRLHDTELSALLGQEEARHCATDAVDAEVLLIDSGGVLRFSHPLLAGLAYAQTPLVERRAAHARLATLFHDPERRARHLAAALVLPDAQAAAEITRACELAAARGALHTAAELAEDARRLTPHDQPDTGWERGLTAAELFTATGEAERAEQLLRDLAHTAPTSSHQARALLATANVLGNDIVRIRQLIDQALTLASHDPQVAATGGFLLGSALFIAGDPDAAIRHLESVVELGRCVGNHEAELEALAQLVIINLTVGTPDLSAVLQAQREAASRANRAQGYLHPATTAGMVCMFRDDPATGRALLRTALADAEQAGDYAAASNVLLHLTETEVRDGRLLAATETAMRFKRYAHVQDDAPVHYAVALAAAFNGDIDTALDAATRGADLARTYNDAIFTAQNLCTLGFLHVSRGDFTAALPALREARALTTQMKVGEPGVYRWHAEHVEASLATNHPDEAADITAELQKHAHALDRPALHALTDRCAALVTAATGNIEAALGTLTRLATHDTTELDFEHARTLLALGTTARRARHKAAARDALTTAQHLFTNMGAKLWAERATNELHRVGLRSTPGGLTETEHRIATLVATGRTNQQIAAELFLTVKTVEANLTRIYRKIHVTSRTQLTRTLTDPDRSS